MSSRTPRILWAVRELCLRENSPSGTNNLLPYIENSLLVSYARGLQGQSMTRNELTVTNFLSITSLFPYILK